MTDETLLDHFQAALQDPERKFDGMPFKELSRLDPLASRDMRIGLKRVKDRLDGVRHFRIADELLPVIAAASVLPPRHLATMVGYAKLPFDRVFIEWNEIARLEALQKLGMTPGPIDVIKKVGALLTEEQDDLFRMMPVFQSDVLGVMLSMTSTLWRTDETIRVTDIDRNVLMLRSLSKMVARELPSHPNIGEASVVLEATTLLSSPYIRRFEHEVKEPLINDQLISIGRRAQMTITEPWYPVLQHRTTQKVMTSEYAQKILIQSTGDFRWMMATLAILHSQGILIDDVPRSRKTRMVAGRPLPYLSHSTVRLQLPAKKLLKGVIKTVESSADYSLRRAHDVRGHWCYSKRYPGKKWFRKAHRRGDATLGVVLQDYRLEADPTFAQ